MKTPSAVILLGLTFLAIDEAPPEDLAMDLKSL